MPAVGDTLMLIAMDSERVLGPVPYSGAHLLPAPRLGSVFQPPRFPTPSMAAYGLLRSKQIELPSIAKQVSASKEKSRGPFRFPMRLCNWTLRVEGIQQNPSGGIRV